MSRVLSKNLTESSKPESEDPKPSRTFTIAEKLSSAFSKALKMLLNSGILEPIVNFPTLEPISCSSLGDSGFRSIPAVLLPFSYVSSYSISSVSAIFSAFSFKIIFT